MHFDQTKNEDVLSGMVVRKGRGQYLVLVDGKNIPCSISSRLRKKLIYPTAAPSSLHHRVQRVDEIDVVDPIAVGDYVTVIDAGDGTGVIHEVLPRQSQVSRKDEGDVPLEMVQAANVDQVMIVFAAARPEPKWNLLDRYLVSAEASNLPAVICMTKLDLVNEASLEAELAAYRQIGYQVLLTSASSGGGIDEARQVLAGHISILMGKSGVGKTSLLNAIQPGLGLRVSQVGKGEVGKGRHTTTTMQMFPLEAGGAVVDTPGMRSYSLWDVDPYELAMFFPEMKSYLGQCQFQSNCLHDNEPNCAVRKAVTAGKISLRRYQSYIKLLNE